MHVLALILIGILVGTLNSLALKWTILQIIKYKSVGLAIISFFIRIGIICGIFYYFLDAKWQNAVFMLLGLTISKIFFILLERKNGIKK